jgi:hypothetical protein
MRLYLLAFLIFTFNCIEANDSIQSQKSFGLIIGYQRATDNLIEFGIAKEYSTSGDPLLFSTPSGGYGLFINGHRYFSLNINYDPSNKLIGYNFGFNQRGLIAYGLNANYYNQNSNSRIGLKPEMGRLNGMKRYHSQQQRNEVGASAGIYIFVIE